MIEFPIIVSLIDPVAIKIGFIQIRWYSIAYVFAIIATMLFIKKNNQNYQILSKKAYDDWLMWAVLSIMIGGRFGYVFFYNFSHYLANPIEMFFIWRGGMSFHGGLIGAIFGMFFFAKKYQINYLKLTDIISVIAPVGLLAGRIANFINNELYGRITNSNYGFIFPEAGDLPRHPSQLYEAFLEGFVLFLIMLILYNFSNLKTKTGSLSGVFLIFYGIFRIIAENFREPDFQIGFIFNNITMGQILSLPMIFIGVFLLFFKTSKKDLLKKK
jgi:phosphatidylglycerol:prolipoprotein diacylglycerol transferase